MGYKEEKESFVSGSTGGTVTRINLVCLTALTTYALWSVVSARAFPRLRPGSWQIPAFEFSILVLPLLLALTAFSSHTFYFNVLLSVLVVASHTTATPSFSVPLSPAPEKHARQSSTAHLNNTLFSRPFVTAYRAIMMVMTVICILAVDFPVFPREFAKAETWGTSLVRASLALFPPGLAIEDCIPFDVCSQMDLGVGSFVFSLGLVSALPLLRRNDQRPYFAAVWSSARKSVGVIALGLIRVLMVKGVDYPEHVTEYGVHWNFFFTMALLPVFGSALERLAIKLDMHWVGLIVTGGESPFGICFHQLWALEAPRTSLISQNKEGLVSFPGYLAIYLLGIASGLYVLPPDPYFFAAQHRVPPADAPPEVKRKVEEKRQRVWKNKPGKLANLLGSYAVIWWALYAVVRWSGAEVSRRLVRCFISLDLPFPLGTHSDLPANLPYVLWTVAFNTSFLFLYLLIHIATASSKSGPGAPAAPAIFEAINRNGLVVFLVVSSSRRASSRPPFADRLESTQANLLTGLVNVSIESMYASDTLAMTVLIAYCSAVVAVAWVLRKRRLRM
ncbi:SPOSA6832_04890 [Sporobolomyces salmonicolor]|uniref:GPI-anchored wall transfer protein n=1 Tax=Sporidiobolus salmonicolor TaxID=5005 RepID=A0A0D6ET29_SPOSA|nr:SPOSA6832_04890 [Sporobolomyces salmonicolor]